MRSWQQEQVGRLAVMRDFPVQQRGRRELLKAFREHFPDQLTGVKAIDRILKELEQCPTPATIKLYAQSMGLTLPAAERLAKVASDQDCRDCGNTGWWETTGGYVHCHCALGRRMAGKEQAIKPAGLRQGNLL